MNKKKPKHEQINRIDQFLRNAKNAGYRVTFTLAVETPYTDDDCCVSGHVLEVDKYDILLCLAVENGTKIGTEVWFKRSSIVTTEIHR